MDYLIIKHYLRESEDLPKHNKMSPNPVILQSENLTRDPFNVKDPSIFRDPVILQSEDIKMFEQIYVGKVLPLASCCSHVYSILYCLTQQ